MLTTYMRARASRRVFEVYEARESSGPHRLQELNQVNRPSGMGCWVSRAEEVLSPSPSVWGAEALLALEPPQAAGGTEGGSSAHCGPS